MLTPPDDFYVTLCGRLFLSLVESQADITVQITRAPT